MKNFINEWEKIDHRTRKTRKALVGALSSIVGEKHLAEVTVSELAKRASITRKTFYNHYRSIEAMVMDVEERVIRSVLTLLDTNRELLRKGNTYEFFVRLTDWLERHQELWRIFSAVKDKQVILEKLKKYIGKYMIRDMGEPLENAAVSSFRVSVYLDTVMNIFVKWLEDSMKVPGEKIAEMAQKLTESFLDRV